MKKSLIALAVVAASGAAMAQSSVTIYGQLDVSYGSGTGASFGFANGKNPAPALGAGLNANGNGAYHGPSRIGFRGTEDLGGGLKANFNLETGDIGMGSSGANLTFNRESWVGLSGGFGEVRLGRSSSIATKNQASFDLNEISTSSALSSVGNSPVTWYGSSRRSNQIQFISANYSGFSGQLGYTTKNDADSAGDKNRTSLGLSYANGPLAVGFVGESAKSAANRTAYALGASYDLGVAKIAGTYNRGESTSAKGYTLGVSAPFGAFVAGAQFGRNTALSVNSQELFVNYNLSKRTRLYADYGRQSKLVTSVAGSGVYAIGSTGAVNSYGIGIIHKF